MGNHALKVISTAEKILEMVEGTLAPLDQVLSRWPAEFRVIMWESVSQMATKRANAARDPKQKAPGNG